MSETPQVVELLEAAERGARARKFLETEFARMDWEPLLVEIQRESLEGALPVPGTPEFADPMRAGARALFLSGQHQAIEEVAKRLKRMVRDGDEAARKLEALKERVERK